MLSPNRQLIIILVGILAPLLLIGGLFWFWNLRHLEVATLDRAQEHWDEGQYRQAEQTLAGVEVQDENGEPIQQREGGFLNDFPRSKRRIEALTMLGRIRIERAIRGQPPEWEKGLEALNIFIDDRRVDEDFNDLHEIIRKYAKEISLGAELPATVDEAKRILDRFAPSGPPTNATQQDPGRG